jgi:ABC-type Fe3+/spermidine/putrescine transport system ATPase subunit
MEENPLHKISRNRLSVLERVLHEQIGISIQIITEKQGQAMLPNDFIPIIEENKIEQVIIKKVYHKQAYKRQQNVY